MLVAACDILVPVYVIDILSILVKHQFNFFFLIYMSLSRLHGHATAHTQLLMSTDVRANHLANLASTPYIMPCSYFKLLPAQNIVVSSAKSINLASFDTLQISLI